MRPVLFSAAAEEDADEAFRWYEAQRVGLGAAFRHSVDVAVAALERGALSYPLVHRGMRRVLLPKFPYGLYYVIQDEKVLVVGCIHAKRHPRVWRSRAEG